MLPFIFPFAICKFSHPLECEICAYTQCSLKTRGCSIQKENPLLLCGVKRWHVAKRFQKGVEYSAFRNKCGVSGQRRECLGSAHVHLKQDRCDFSGWSRRGCRERELLCALNWWLELVELTGDFVTNGAGVREGNKDVENGMEAEERIEWPCVSKWKIQRISLHWRLERLSRFSSRAVPSAKKLLVSP